MMHDIMNSDYYHKLPDWVKYAVLLSIITYDLYVDFSYLFVCNRIADLVLRNNKEITENGLVGYLILFNGKKPISLKILAGSAGYKKKTNALWL